jgi:hypothetical protein
MQKVSERDVCRIIMDRNEVLSSKIAEIVIAAVGNDTDSQKLKELVDKIKGETTKMTNTTLDAVIKQFSK